MFTRREVYIACLCLSFCNHFHERLANIGKIATFTGGTVFLMPSFAGFLEPRKSRLEPLKSTFNAENSIRMKHFAIACKN